MCTFGRGPRGDFDSKAAGYSPDRVDALVWALTDLLIEPGAAQGIYEVYRRLNDRRAEFDPPKA
ncbi:MAG: hypothetical protein ACREFH_13720, partial [Stellaceae bacterium]